MVTWKPASSRPSMPWEPWPHPLGIRPGSGVELHMAGQRGVHAETGEANHRMFGVFEGADGFRIVEEAGFVEADGRAGAVAGGGHMPACGQERRFAVLPSLRRSGAVSPGRSGGSRRAWEAWSHRFQMVHECGHQGFHAFDRNGVGDGFEHVLSIGNRTDQGFGAGAHGVGQLQFTACGGQMVLRPSP